MSLRRSVLVIAVALSSAGCSGRAPAAGTTSAPVIRTSGEPEELTYAASLGVDLTLMTRSTTGLYYRDLLVGNGEAPSSENRVWVNYTGWLVDGSMFDQNRDGRPLVTRLDHLIPGFREGLEGMRTGGRRLLVIRPELAYGKESPAPQIPSNATLVFDVQLVRISD